jgi:hypothetical protein
MDPPSLRLLQRDTSPHPHPQVAITRAILPSESDRGAQSMKKNVRVKQVVDVQEDVPEKDLLKGDRLYLLSNGEVVMRRRRPREEFQRLVEMGLVVPSNPLAEETGEFAELNRLMDEADAEFDGERGN